MSNSDLEKAVKEFGRRCSNISRIYSVDGVPLWVVEISDKPGEDEPEPAFKLLLILANWLCDNYMVDPLVIFFYLNVHEGGDGNANNIDLNRDFPDRSLANVKYGFSVNNDLDARQPETKAIINWMRQINFAASATLHGGALVANYPWDANKENRKSYFACPDDDTFRFMASTYSLSHHNMSLSKEFPGGITNGASWYPIYGGMQDWNYIHAGCLELTLEISDNKWPIADELPTLWEYNKMSLLNLIASVAKIGVHGRIFSSNSGTPLPGFITIKGINYTVAEGFLITIILAPGRKYEVMATMPGYKSKTTSIWLEEAAVTADFILDPDFTARVYQQRFCDCDCDCGGRIRIGILWSVHSLMYVIMAVILGFVCVLLKRRMKFNFWSHRRLAKRPLSGMRDSL
ncbi:hypothetical protein K2173_011182 [Erythroxylum novogranatense]|uniref:Peptidase M14 domain-containing protein n=1 Tax=Erythroxylum novogranatense TaxID=1862640 RepID=A0AAV8TW41_9ROSI|nr:hypothetical protein K2173_011182 [Erythroxylum novogranatense]